MRDLTGVELDFSALVGIPEDSTGSSFENVAAALNLPPSLLEKYFAAADMALTRLFGEPDPQSSSARENSSASASMACA